jgi:hypothetical protein
VSNAVATPSAFVPDLMRVAIMPSSFAGASATSANRSQIGDPQSTMANFLSVGRFSSGSVTGKAEGRPE